MHDILRDEGVVACDLDVLSVAGGDNLFGDQAVGGDGVLGR